jgi:hypothetical protein
MKALVYVNAFLLGTVLMSLEMLGSRYLGPYFGYTIHIWAGLISTVLAALAIGYFLGGYLADRFESAILLGAVVFLASAYVALIPQFLDWICLRVAFLVEDPAVGGLLACGAILFVPLMCMAIFTPFGIRMVLLQGGRPGTVSGTIYGISTIGNIFGILFTTFYLIPRFGSRSITFGLAVALFVCSLSFFIYSSTTSRNRHVGKENQ